MGYESKYSIQSKKQATTNNKIPTLWPTQPSKRWKKNEENSF